MKGSENEVRVNKCGGTRAVLLLLEFAGMGLRPALEHGGVVRSEQVDELVCVLRKLPATCIVVDEIERAEDVVGVFDAIGRDRTLEDDRLSLTKLELGALDPV